MIYDELEFEAKERCEYEGHNLYFGKPKKGGKNKWVYITDEMVLFETYGSKTRPLSLSLRIKNAPAFIKSKHFYETKIKKLREKFGETLTVKVPNNDLKNE